MILLDNLSNSGVNYKGLIEKSEEDPFQQVKIIKELHGLDHEYILNEDFFTSAEYLLVAELGDKLDGLLDEGAYIQRGEKSRDVSNFRKS